MTLDEFPFAAALRDMAANRYTVDQVKRMYALAALEAAGGNVSEACHSLGLARNTFYQWVEQEGVEISRKAVIRPKPKPESAGPREHVPIRA